ncbi:hypothetical protein EDD22DRAFT_957479 [Suillus occidentalis]|nr:hypothetical protein EDD22DRAFT_957479 [Suillus occidentalis]
MHCSPQGNGKGYFIDFDHAKFLNDDGKADLSPRGTGTVPYISFHVLCLMGDGHLVQHMPCDDLESLFYILLKFTVIYLGLKGVLAPKPSSEALRRDAVRSIWKQEFINGLADPPLITPYFILCCPLLEEWHFSKFLRCLLLHFQHLYLHQNQPSALLPPPAPPSALESTIAPLPPPASTLQQVATIAVSQTVPPIPSSVPPSPPTVT